MFYEPVKVLLLLDKADTEGWFTQTALLCSDVTSAQSDVIA